MSAIKLQKDLEHFLKFSEFDYFLTYKNIFRLISILKVVKTIF